MTDLRAAALTARTAADTVRDALHAHAGTCRPCGLGQYWLCDAGKPLSAEFTRAASASADAHQAYAPTGSIVTYHGSKSYHHGHGWTVRGITHASYGTAYTIVRNIGCPQDDVLSGVSIESITLHPHVPVPAALAAEVGFPATRLTAAAWADTVAWTEEDTDRTGAPQDEDGRLWDVLVVARNAARTVREDRPETFPLYRVPRDGEYGGEPQEIQLRLSLNRDEDAAVFTISLPGEL